MTVGYFALTLITSPIFLKFWTIYIQISSTIVIQCSDKGKISYEINHSGLYVSKRVSKEVNMYTVVGRAFIRSITLWDYPIFTSICDIDGILTTKIYLPRKLYFKLALLHLDNVLFRHMFLIVLLLRISRLLHQLLFSYIL